MPATDAPQALSPARLADVLATCGLTPVWDACTDAQRAALARAAALLDPDALLRAGNAAPEVGAPAVPRAATPEASPPPQTPVLLPHPTASVVAAGSGVHCRRCGLTASRAEALHSWSCFPAPEAVPPTVDAVPAAAAPTCRSCLHLRISQERVGARGVATFAACGHPHAGSPTTSIRPDAHTCPDHTPAPEASHAQPV